MSDDSTTTGNELATATSTEVALPAELESPSGLTSAIYSAIDAQRSVAISYVRNVRRKQPDATPAEIIKSLERHYLVSVTASGTAVGATAFIPGAGTAIALGAGAAELLLQFELAALFGLASAEVHGLKIPERDRARALILSLMLGQEGRNKVASLAKAAIQKDPAALAGVAGRTSQLSGVKSLDELPLGELLGAAVPGDFMPSILDSVQDLAKKRMPERAAAATTRLVPGGIGMFLGGFGGYTAGNDVVQAARQAFGDAPGELPEWLEPIDSDGDGIPDPSAFEVGMRGAVGKFVEVGSTAKGSVTLTAAAAAGGMAAAAKGVSNQFRSVDLDGDGIPDEARALTAAKGVGKAASGAAGAVRGTAAGLFKRKQRADGSTEPDDAGESDA